MLKYKDMWNVYTNDEGFSMDDPQGVFNLADAKAMLEQALASHSIPVTITSDTVKCGGLFSKDDRECLVLTSTEHKRNYYQYVLIIKKEYGRTYLTYCKMGQSKDMGKEAAKQGAREARNSYASQQGGLGAHLGAAMGNAIGGIGAGKRQARIESEKTTTTCWRTLSKRRCPPWALCEVRASVTDSTGGEEETRSKGTSI